jgi:hypothetical protein
MSSNVQGQPLFGGATNGGIGDFLDFYSFFKSIGYVESAVGTRPTI